jgi:endonuclease III related protein
VIGRLYGTLLREYGPQGWWPLTSLAGRPGFDSRGYHPGQGLYAHTPGQRFEIALGAVLTQNTAWSNVEKALRSLFAAGVRSPKAVLGCTQDGLAALVRSSGYHNQKARTLRVLAGFFEAPARLRAGRPPGRDDLLALRGIGEETADSIALYAFGQPVFVVDAYTRRVLARLGIAMEGDGTGAIQRIFHEALPADPELFGEYHALIVAHARAHCRSRPLCAGCPVRRCPGREHPQAVEPRPRGRTQRAGSD